MALSLLRAPLPIMTWVGSRKARYVAIPNNRMHAPLAKEVQSFVGHIGHCLGLTPNYLAAPLVLRSYVVSCRALPGTLI
jgi:hypothetical protein